MNSRLSNLTRTLLIGTGAAVGGYTTLVAWHRMRYGRPARIAEPGDCSLLDRFVPVTGGRGTPSHRHRRSRRSGPGRSERDAAARFAAGPRHFKARELVLGGEPDTRVHPQTLFEQMRSIGWVVLAERPGHELVMGAATVPWHANPVFRSVAAGDFRAFREPGYVKIAWSLRAEPASNERTMFHTETRVSTTDPEAREHFRRYWSFVAPGVALIRVAMLGPLKRDAERRVQFTAA